MSDISMPFGLDPSVVLTCAKVDGVSAIEAGAYFTTREADYLLSVPETHEAAVRVTIAAAPTEMPLPVPEKVSQTQFMRASVRMKFVTPAEAEAYLATGALPDFVAKPLDDLPDDLRADARLKAIGASDFYRDDALFGILITGSAATVEQVDDLFRLAGTLT